MDLYSHMKGLLENVDKENSILYLPTGFHKFYIALMLIKKRSFETHKELRNGGKRSFFLTDAIPYILEERIHYFHHFLPGNVCSCFPDDGASSWDKDTWHDKFEKYQVFVTNAHVLFQLLEKRYIDAENINVLVFDECHDAPQSADITGVMHGLKKHGNGGTHPRILGLTSLLVKDAANITEQVAALEKTLCSVAVTIPNRCSSKPRYRLETYNPECNYDSLKENVEKVFTVITDCIQTLEAINSPPDIFENISKGMVLVEESTENPLTQFIKCFLELRSQLHIFGIHGTNESALVHIVQFLRWHKKSDDPTVHAIITGAITYICQVRKMLADMMKNNTPSERIHQFSSPKFLKLFEILRFFKEHWIAAAEKRVTLKYDLLATSNTLIQKPRALIVVDKTHTARVVYRVLQSLANDDPDFGFLIPDFVIGFSLSDEKTRNSREMGFEKRTTTRAIKRFNDGKTNVLICTNILEKDINIDQCCLVVAFDELRSYESYVRLEGRVKEDGGTFILMASSSTAGKSDYETKLQHYYELEDQVRNLLSRPSSHGVCCANNHEECSTSMEAMSVIKRYCEHLPHDRFTQLLPRWSEDLEAGKPCLRLPVNCPLREVTKGSNSTECGKCAVILKTQKKLQDIGELDENFLPIRNIIDSGDSFSELFPLWKSDDFAEKLKDQPGGSRKTRRYSQKLPELLNRCRPVTDKDAYLHLIRLKPAYERPCDNDTRLSEFYKVLCSRSQYAMLSSKQLPKLCKFFIFMNVGKIEVEIASDYSVIKLNSEQINAIRQFHITICMDILNFTKDFMVYDKKGMENSFFFVPVNEDSSGVYTIDWNIVDRHKVPPTTERPSDEERAAMTFTREGYHNQIVSPWYRSSLMDQYYLVTQVCDELSPMSPFPSDNYDSYLSYFDNKYNLRLFHPNQPMLEVKELSHKHSWFRERTSKNKKKFDEHLIPELCIKWPYPADLWLKGTCLPAVTHMLFHLVLAEEFRQSLSSDLGITFVSPTVDSEWKTLEADQGTFSEEPEAVPPTSVDLQFPVTLKARMNLGDGDEGEEETDKEPVDIYRCISEISSLDVIYYEEYVGKTAAKVDEVDDFYGLNVTFVDLDKTVDMKIIEKDSDTGYKVELCDVLKVLTAKSANEVYSSDKMAILGMPYLWFVVSLYLFTRYPSFDEGKLTQLRARLLSHRNMFYCGAHHQLGEIIKVNDFIAVSDFVPPSFIVPHELQQIILDAELSPRVLFDMFIPREEQESGTLSRETWESIQYILMEDDTAMQPHNSSLESFLTVKTVSDRTIAETVKALAGLYFEVHGMRGAVPLLTWFRIIPSDPDPLSQMFNESASGAKLNLSDDTYAHSAHYSQFEETLNYSFKDRSYLLQALTHPSYESNCVTDCYQRLTFLGNSILGLLLTCYVHENCKNFTIVQTLDLLSALINNVTYASLAVRNNFHKFLLFNSPPLIIAMEKFIHYFEMKNFAITEEILILIEERDVGVTEPVEVPAVFSDLFQSVAAAIYLDSGKSLSTVWRVYYRLMKKELEQFTVWIPKQFITELNEHSPSKPGFMSSVKKEEQNTVAVPVDVIVRGKKETYVGFGRNRFSSKLAAAKLALRQFFPECGTY